jgi:hypothetical protein
MGPCFRRDDIACVRYEAIALQHPQRLHVGFQDGLLLLALIGILLAQPDDLAQRFDVKAYSTLRQLSSMRRPPTELEPLLHRSLLGRSRSALPHSAVASERP